jgi:3-polyprenyl-4-hydroxybenzoate decarboxylase
MSTTASPLDTTQPGVQQVGPDLRSWLATLEAAGQLRRVTASVDWNEEIGAITRANLSLGGPALLFENIAGHEDTRCTKFLTSAIGNRRLIQLLLGLPDDTSDSAIVRHLRETFKCPTGLGRPLPGLQARTHAGRRRLRLARRVAVLRRQPLPEGRLRMGHDGNLARPPCRLGGLRNGAVARSGER